MDSSNCGQCGRDKQISFEFGGCDCPDGRWFCPLCYKGAEAAKWMAGVAYPGWARQLPCPKCGELVTPEARTDAFGAVTA